MEKIQSIEKLFTLLLEYSYLILPIIYILSSLRLNNWFKNDKIMSLLLGIYGLYFFLLLHFYNDIPKDLKKLYQSVYTFSEYLFFAYILYHFISNKLFRKAILGLSALFLVVQIAHYFFTKNQKLDSFSIGIETILIFLFIFTYFRQFFKHNVTRNIYEYQRFWLIVGILLYLGCGFFFNILVNYIPKDQFLEFWHYTYIPEIIKNILFTIVILGVPSLTNEKSQPRKKFPDVPNLDII